MELYNKEKKERHEGRWPGRSVFDGIWGHPCKWSPRQAHAGSRCRTFPPFEPQALAPKSSLWLRREAGPFIEHLFHFTPCTPDPHLPLTPNILLLMQLFKDSPETLPSLSREQVPWFFLKLLCDACNVLCEYSSHTCVPCGPWLTIHFTGKVWSHWAERGGMSLNPSFPTLGISFHREMNY